MDRYWIVREAAGETKISLPTEEDLSKYGQKEKDPIKDRPDYDFLLEKAELCAKIVKIKEPDIKEEDIARRAKYYMGNSMADLTTLYSMLKKAESYQ